MFLARKRSRTLGGDPGKGLLKLLLKARLRKAILSGSLVIPVAVSGVSGICAANTEWQSR